MEPGSCELELKQKLSKSESKTQQIVLKELTATSIIIDKRAVTKPVLIVYITIKLITVSVLPTNSISETFTSRGGIDALFKSGSFCPQESTHRESNDNIRGGLAREPTNNEPGVSFDKDWKVEDGNSVIRGRMG